MLQFSLKRLLLGVGVIALVLGLAFGIRDSVASVLIPAVLVAFPVIVVSWLVAMRPKGMARAFGMGLLLGITGSFVILGWEYARMAAWPDELVRTPIPNQPGKYDVRSVAAATYWLPTFWRVAVLASFIVTVVGGLLAIGIAKVQRHADSTLERARVERAQGSEEPHLN